MKKTWNACHGSLPSAVNSTKPISSVAATATSGETAPATREGSGRGSREEAHQSPSAPAGEKWRSLCAPPAMNDPLIRRPISSALVSAARFALRQAALRDHRQPVADLEQLVELLGDHQHRDAGVAQVEQRLADLRRGADVDAPGRLRRDQHPRMLPDLAADDELLQVAAGQAARGRLRAAGLDPVLGDRRLREVAHGAETHEAVAREPLPARGQERVLGQRHLGHRAAAQPLLGHEAEAERASLVRVERADRAAVDA